MGKPESTFGRFSEVVYSFPAVSRAIAELRDKRHPVTRHAFLLSVTLDPRVNQVIENFVNPDRRLQDVFTDETFSLSQGYTDLISYQASACCIGLIDDDRLGHWPLAPHPEGILRDYTWIAAQLMTYLSTPPRRYMRLVPGFLWSNREVKDLKTSAQEFYPGVNIEVSDPGNYVVWLGQTERGEGTIVYEHQKDQLDIRLP